VNVSVLKQLGPGVTAGFVVGGSTPRTVLVRAIGPTLGAAPFNVPGVVIDPQLALTVLNSLPLLVRDPLICVEQYLNRYVPLAIVNSFYRKHPKMAAAVKKIPKRETPLPA
jgi:hypothetical protein